MEKKQIKISISTLIIFIIALILLVAVVIMGMHIANQNKVLEASRLAMENKENNNSNVTNNTTNNNSSKKINYIELNETNYYKYPLSRVVDISNNNNGTHTITSRVYEEATLPTLSKEELLSLDNGGSVDILGYTCKKNDSMEPIVEEDIFYIKSVDKNDWMDLGVKRNEHGTATLFYCTEMTLGKPTQTYMRATVDNSVFGDKFRDFYETDSNEIDLEKYYTLINGVEEFGFEDGKISYFDFTGV